MAEASRDSFSTRTHLVVGGKRLAIWSLARLEEQGFPVGSLPFSLKVLLENLLRREDGRTVTREDIEAVARWDPAAEPDREVAMMPARVLLQDFTGVPAVVDLAAMRDAMAELGGDSRRINPLLPSELVVDHSVQVDAWGTPDAFRRNAELEFERNRERYALLRWAQGAFTNFRVVPPDTGIVHQVNLEYLARVVVAGEADGEPAAWPDTVVGTDSHTTMVNALGVLGWGVGGIEAEAAMLGQPMSLLVPQVVGFRLHGALPETATATDLVLTVTQILRARGVVGKFVEFFGDGVGSLSLADRATIANMAPEYGATCGIFPIDGETMDYLRLTGRPPEQVALVEAYARAQGLFRVAGTLPARYSEVVELDLGTIVPSVAGPRRPQDRVPLAEVVSSWRKALPTLLAARSRAKVAVGATAGPEEPAAESRVRTRIGDREVEIAHGSVVIAAITSCTNTSNPSVLVAAGLLARKAVERGLGPKPWVKTSLAPGSKAVTAYLKEAGLLSYLERLDFHLVGYGCTTCIGNSGPLPEPVSRAVREGDLVAVAVLSGNRNFEGRINPDARANYLASPPLVVAYALAGRIDHDFETEPLGTDLRGRKVFLRDIWPTPREVHEAVRSAVRSRMFSEVYEGVFAGDERWRSLPVPEGDRFAWDPASTYVRRPPYFEGMSLEPTPPDDILGARVLAVLGDSITTDHISPAGNIAKDSPAGRHLRARGVAPEDFNQYGARRGNHEVMIRGTFANARLKNDLVPDSEGWWTAHLPGGERVTIEEAAERYRREGVPLLVLAGKEYGSGSSRDWAAKGTLLLGVRAVVAESYERIHRSNLIGMGVLPLQFLSGQNRRSLGLDGRETWAIEGIAAGLAPGRRLAVTTTAPDGATRSFELLCRLDTRVEVEYYRHGGILPFVLRSLLRS